MTVKIRNESLGVKIRMTFNQNDLFSVSINLDEESNNNPHLGELEVCFEIKSQILDSLKSAKSILKSTTKIQNFNYPDEAFVTINNTNYDISYSYLDYSGVVDGIHLISPDTENEFLYYFDFEINKFNLLTSNDVKDFKTFKSQHNQFFFFEKEQHLNILHAVKINDISIDEMVEELKLFISDLESILSNNNDEIDSIKKLINAYNIRIHEFKKNKEKRKALKQKKELKKVQNKKKKVKKFSP